MEWYYSVNDQQIGPISDDDLDNLVTARVIGLDSLVWHAGMSEWQSLREVRTGAPPALTPQLPRGFCTECGNPYPESDLLTYGVSHVCGNCKGTFLQRIKQGVPLPYSRRYAGFWIRFLAIFIDGLILGLVSIIINLSIGGGGSSFSRLGRMSDPGEITAVMAGFFGIAYFVNMAIAISYHAYFLSQHGATPGKMALNLQVIRADGGPISVGLAIGRYFAYWLDSITLLIGYIMAAFDSEKRALHDRICGTRVIYKS
jgi:uncharacterized RDD family membrane protein YckC